MNFKMEYRYVPYTALIVVSDHHLNNFYIQRLTQRIKNLTECSLIEFTSCQISDIELVTKKMIDNRVEQIVFQPVFKRNNFSKYKSLKKDINKALTKYVNLKIKINSEVSFFDNVSKKIIENLEEAIQ